jgi:MFS family permease
VKPLTCRFLTSGFGISIKRFVATMALFSPTLAWFYLFHVFLLDEIVTSLSVESIWLYIGKTLFYISVGASLVIGSIISERVPRRTFLKYWILSGVLFTALFAVCQGLICFLLLCTLAGASFGLGFPACQAFLADSTIIEKRASVSGVVLLATFISLILVIQTSIMLDLPLIQLVLLTIILRSISFFTLLLDPCERVPGKKKTWLSVLTTRGFGFYFLPWILFNVTNGISAFLETWLYQSLGDESIYMLGPVFLYAGTSIFAIISGFASDRFGRKPTIMFGLITLGISYALLALVTTTVSYLITQIAVGAAWGTIAVAYALTVLGDFATDGSKERFYALGGFVPLMFIMAFQLLADFVEFSESISLISSMLSMILFISIIPLLYAPETLPKEKIRQRKVEKHLQKLKKLVMDEKNQNQD